MLLTEQHQRVKRERRQQQRRQVQQVEAGGSGGGGQQPLQNQQQQVVNMPDPVPKNPAGKEIMNIPLYSGSKKEDPEIWLDCVDNAQSTFNWTPEGKIGAATRLG